jgi:hypothetical protein
MSRHSLPSPLADHDVIEQGDSSWNHLIPISHLQLDLGEPPVGGWTAYLAGRGIPIVDDEIGRLAITTDDARMLLTEKRENEIRNREVLERHEAQLIQQDQLMRANMPTGIPAGMVPDGMTGAEAMVLAGEKRRPRSVREQLLEKELSHRPPELVYQSIGPDEG